MKFKDWQNAVFLLFGGLKEADTIFTHMTFDEKKELFDLAKGINGVFVEIGSYLGASSCFIAQGIKRSGSGSRLYCIDTWNNDAMSEGVRDTYDEFMKNTEKYNDIIVPIRETSENAVAVLQKQIKKIDMLFIDADHNYEGCKRDWDLYSQFLRSGSVVVFHDYGWAEGVKKVVDEDVKPLISNEGILPNMWWGWLK